ncbi:MAG: hypothetical protein R3B71_02055 [Candidatus Gracilibacteria bacterium]|nr:hypothetical protein [Candidatus Peregrinibacteria bacterium]
MNPNPEKNLGKGIESSAEKQAERQQESVEIQEALQGSEVAEFVEGNIAETVGEDKKKAPTSQGSGTKKVYDDTASTAKTISLPSVDVMRVQVSTRVKKEIAELEKKANKIMRNPSKAEPFQLNILISRIRYLRNILSQLAHATSEGVKNLWQKFIKGASN